MTLPAATHLFFDKRHRQAYMHPYVHDYLRLSMQMYMLMHQQQMQRSTECIVYYALQRSE